MFRAFFLGFDTFLLQSFTYSIAYSMVSLKIILFPLFLSPFHSFFLPLKTQSLAFSGSSRGCLFGILFKGSLVVQEARVATAKGW